MHLPLCIFAFLLPQVHSDLAQLAIDKEQVFRVRELELSNGGAKLYLSEGVLAFATAVDGKRVAAVFTTAQSEAGDGELIAFPPNSAERASLARFAKSPNFDEHFSAAFLFFADNAGENLLQQIHSRPLHAAPELAADLGKTFDEPLRASALEIEVRITQSILDRHRPQDGFLYAMLAGRTLGAFDFVYQPDQVDSVVFGQVVDDHFKTWCAYRPKNTPGLASQSPISDYRLDTTIHPDLSMTSTANFDYRADSNDGRVVSLSISPRLRILSASIDGQTAAVLAHDSARGPASFLVVNSAELISGRHYKIEIKYEGSVIDRQADESYFVDDRNLWYPFIGPMLSTFDLTFHFPEKLRLVSTGEPISQTQANGERTIHSRTARAQSLAGFNLGEYSISSTKTPRYTIEICSNPQVAPPPALGEQAAHILQYYSDSWMPLATRHFAITPINGYFGQGFPGLIYLSNVSYLRERDRPQALRNPALDAFFSQLLLPHELAHQWWGNIVSPTDYRSNWIVEAMSNYAALQYLEQSEGKAVLEAVLESYRKDLTRPLVDSYGPLTFDERLLNNFGIGVWHDILYEKGTWVLHMLRQRLGDAGFHEFQLRVLKDFANKPITNEDLREAAARFTPANEMDRKLSAFFDTWVYDTGIPTLELSGSTLKVSGVADSYSVNLPLRCGDAVLWVRAGKGETALAHHNCSLPSTANFLFKK